MVDVRVGRADYAPHADEAVAMSGGSTMQPRMKNQATVLTGAMFLCVAVVTSCSYRPTEDSARSATASPQPIAATEERMTTNEAEVRELIDGFVRAISTKNIDGVMSVYAPELVAFDIVPPLQYEGAAAFRKVWQGIFELFQDPIQYEIRDLSIIAGDDVAFSHSFNRLNGTMKNGRKSDLWVRWTACFRKTKGSWRIVHVQVSVPVDLASGKAVLDLKP
jgi:ketosteroid isomerase-like protein